MKKVIIAAGGTGGHIYPALAFAETLKKQHPECEIVFFGSSNRMEAQLIPEKGYRFIGMEMTGTNGNLIAKAKSFYSLLKARKRCFSILNKEKPDACIGFGNYISVPLIQAAHKLSIPTMISEQNSFAGKANAFLAREADAVETAYESSMKNLPAEKTRLYGNPDATAAMEKTALVSPSVYGIDEAKPFVVFMMGSLGSETVSAVIDEAVTLFDPSFQVLIASGKANDYEWKSRGENVHIVSFIDGISMLKKSSLAVCRAGATTLCEIAAIGTPSILIPSPFVPNNHQVYNAMEFVKRNAAVMIEEKNLTPAVLAQKVNELMKDKTQRDTLHKNALALGTPDAAYKMVTWLEELIQNA